ncbi:MAG: hypothetical protein MUE51_02725 [Thermoleophilia bacterium]|nr:hypothetical protein [Thermoleophilia bacterium]
MRNPRAEARQAEEAKAAQSGKKPAPRGKGAPVRPGFRSVLIRAMIASIIFFVFLILVAGDSPAAALLFTAGLFVIMIPVGMMLDRLSHRMALRRWERRRAGNA